MFSFSLCYFCQKSIDEIMSVICIMWLYWTALCVCLKDSFPSLLQLPSSIFHFHFVNHLRKLYGLLNSVAIAYHVQFSNIHLPTVRLFSKVFWRSSQELTTSPSCHRGYQNAHHGKCTPHPYHLFQPSPDILPSGNHLFVLQS